jgi:hypothetical protein
MEPGEFLTRWTVRLAMILYVVALSIWITSRQRASWLHSARLAWTLGSVAFLGHVLCAFAFYHHWSHAAAYRDTASRAEEVMGISWGGGLYLNYAFTAFGMTDVIFWWRDLDRSRYRGIQIVVQAFLAFIAFSATVVFGAGMIRWLGIGATLLFLILVWRCKWAAGLKCGHEYPTKLGD